MTSSRLILLGWGIFRTKCAEKLKTFILCSNNPLPKSCLLWNNVEKMWGSQTDQIWQYNKGHAYYMRNNYGYRHTLRICDTHCFSTATTVTRTRPSTTSYVNCLSCYATYWPEDDQNIAETCSHIMWII